jgi:DNA relaxase NicK
MQVSKSIDYMQFSSKHKPDASAGRWKLKPSYVTNYKVMYVYDNGVTAHSGHNKSDKFLMIYHGEQCEQIPDTKLFITNQIKNGATFSRLDLCVTVADGITVDDFRQWVADKKVSGSLFETGCKTILNDKTTLAETTYIGDMATRAKKGIFRAYNKGVQLNLDDLKLARFELEERKQRAQISAKRYADGYDIGDLIRQRVDVDNDQWRDVMGTKSDVLKRYKVEHVQESHDSTWKWLIEVVAKTLGEKIADEIIAQDGSNNFELFQETLQKVYNKRINELLNQQWFN